MDIYYTVKADAFTIRQTQLDTAMELLSWEDGTSNSRLNRTEDIEFPIEESVMALKENRLIEIHEHSTQNKNSPSQTNITRTSCAAT